LTKLTDAQLIERFSVANKTQRHLAVRVLAERHKSPASAGRQELIARLGELLPIAEFVPTKTDYGPCLEALWTLHLLDALSDQQLEQSLQHPLPDVRRWALRLIGDRRHASEVMLSTMTLLAVQEQERQVLSQLASTVRRLSAAQAVQVLPTLLARGDVLDDPHLPLLIWWAVEAQSAASPAQISPQVAVPLPAEDSSGVPRERLLKLWETPENWQVPVAQKVVLRRLMQRFALESVVAADRPGATDTAASSLAACVRLFELAPTPADKELLMGGFLEAYEGRPIDNLPEPLATTISEYRKSLGTSDLALSIKLGDAKAIEQALGVVRNEGANVSERLTYLELLGQSKKPEVVGALLGLLGSPSPGVKRVAMLALMNFDEPRIGADICSRWHSTLTTEHNVRGVALQVLASRPSWSLQLLQEIAEFRIKPAEVPLDIVQQMRLHQHEELQKQLDKFWGKTRSTPEEKQIQVARIRQLLASSDETPDPLRGHALFKQHCAVCHTLFNEGGQTGPNLTGYERTNLDFMLLAMVDPSAAIREEFTQYQIALKDGRILTGLIDQQTPTVVTLRGANNQTTTINRADIEELKAMPTSLMPDGLMEKLTDEEIRHLFSFLTRRTPVIQ
jgi:putative heme-binding domain-containing protein